MAKLIELKTISDDRGDLTVIEKILPFDIKRVYYIYNTNGKSRGNHKHKKNIQALVCISGSCKIKCYDEIFLLDSPKKCLILNPEDYHEMYDFSNQSILLVLSSEHYDENDYIRHEN